MTAASYYLLAADGILLLHTVFVAFVVLGQLLIMAGKVRHWSWVTNPWFRVLHLLAIAVVVVQAWLGSVCPLTSWEMALRTQAGDSVYPGSFMAHWLAVILYYQAPPRVFVIIYTVFAALVVASWFVVRPRRFGKRRNEV